jgi:bla regulator protein blaR1
MAAEAASMGMSKGTACWGACVAALAAATAAQTATPAGGPVAQKSAQLRFEVASIRPAKPGTFFPPTFPLSPDDSYVAQGGYFRADFPLMNYITFAYKLWLTREEREALLRGLPDWVATESWVIEAKAEGNPTKDDVRAMMRTLLGERFGLHVHFATETMPVFVMTLEKPGVLGPKLLPHDQGPPCPAPGTTFHGTRTGDDSVFPPVCDSVMMVARQKMLLNGERHATMEVLADALAEDGELGRPVVDRTGLTGRFDWSIEWTPATSGGAVDDDSDPNAATFWEALKDQLGLKLKAGKSPVRTLVIDHVELPSAN